MTDSEASDPWLGSIGQDKRFLNRVSTVVYRNGLRSRRGKSRFHFNGSRIGKGAGIGRVLSTTARFSSPQTRKVSVIARIVRFKGPRQARSVIETHLHYLSRDGAARDGSQPDLYTADLNQVDIATFRRGAVDDRHQFRMIVVADDAADYEDLKPLVRRLVSQVSQDLRVDFDWVAADHFNTGRPHSHIVMRGRDRDGADIIIATEYLHKGIKARASDLVTLDLGPRNEWDVARERGPGRRFERLIATDLELLAAVDADGLVSAHDVDLRAQSEKAARLQTLRRMGLASEERGGRWRLDPASRDILEAMGRRSDSFAALDEEVRRDKRVRSPADYNIHTRRERAHATIVGRVMSHGLGEGSASSPALVIDGIDGQVHWLEIPDWNGSRLLKDAIVRVESLGPHSASVGVGDVNTPAAQTRAQPSQNAEKGSEVSYANPDLKVSTNIEVLSLRALEILPEHDGATWLDRLITGDDAARFERGFGAEVRSALGRRSQWLVAQGMAQAQGDGIEVRTDLLQALERREVERVLTGLTQELGKPFAGIEARRSVGGSHERPVAIGEKRFALIQHSHEFTLVPWDPDATVQTALERERSGPGPALRRDHGPDIG